TFGKNAGLGALRVPLNGSSRTAKVSLPEPMTEACPVEKPEPLPPRLAWPVPVKLLEVLATLNQVPVATTVPVVKPAPVARFGVPEVSVHWKLPPPAPETVARLPPTPRPIVAVPPVPAKLIVAIGGVPAAASVGISL